jgi:putative phage-type endonuclease
MSLANDTSDADIQRRTEIIKQLKEIKVPAQRTKEWFAQRDRMITASDIGTAIGVNPYEPQYMVILKKITDIPFLGLKAAHHGKKYEHIATQIYSCRMDVQVGEYGCIEHPCGFLGASPDGIVDVFKRDGIHKTKLVGRQLEIKCVDTRKINMESNDIRKIVPEYYYPQPQIQMQCCNLDECDFWQCNIKEYASRQEFMSDTDPNTPFMSLSTGFEKGVLIQLIPIDVHSKTSRQNTIYNHAKFIYPERIDMSPSECDEWIIATTTTYHLDPQYANYAIDQVIYWHLVESRCVTIKRDDAWFVKHYPTLEQMWKYVNFFRKNETQKQLLIQYIEHIKPFKNANNLVMKVAQQLFDTGNKKYKTILANVTNEIADFAKPNASNEDDDFNGFTVC